jgi:hypothetical protein
MPLAVAMPINRKTMNLLLAQKSMIRSIIASSSLLLAQSCPLHGVSSLSSKRPSYR